MLNLVVINCIYFEFIFGYISQLEFSLIRVTNYLIFGFLSISSPGISFKEQETKDNILFFLWRRCYNYRCSTIFQLYRGSQFYCCTKRSTCRKSTSQYYTLSHKFYEVKEWNHFTLHNSVSMYANSLVTISIFS